MYEKIKKFYVMNLWTADMVKSALDKDIISETEYNQILNSK
jgi:hypothetical protein